MERQASEAMAAPGSPGAELEAVRDLRRTAETLVAQGRSEEAFEQLAAALSSGFRRRQGLELLLAELDRERLSSRPTRSRRSPRVKRGGR